MLYRVTATGFAVAALLLAFRFIAYSDEWHRIRDRGNGKGTWEWKAKRFLAVVSYVFAAIIVIFELIKWLRE